MYRKVFNAMLVVLIALSLSTPAMAQESGRQFASGEAKSYIVVMAADAILAYDGGLAGYAATKPEAGKKVNPNSAHVRKYESFLESKHDKSLQDAGVSTDAKVHDYAFALNGYSAILTQAEVNEIKAQKDVVLVLEDQMRYADTDSSPTFLGLTAEGGAYVKGYRGDGVVVGIIDTGIWPEHPSFADDGSFPAPPTGPLPCQFGNTAHNPNDAPFTCNNKLIGARQMLETYRAVIGAAADEFNSARDDSGHGTHTASTSAGNSGVAATLYGMPAGTISGIAPRAHIIAYKGLGNLGGFTSDLAAAIDQAVADGVDVINYSIGGGAGAVSADEIAFLLAADAGVFVASSAGNSGPNPSTLGDPGTKPWLTTVGASTQSRFLQGTITLGNGAQYTGASITAGVGPAPLVDAATLGNDLCNPAVPFSSSVAGKIVLCRRGTVARVAKSQAVLIGGGVGMIMYENSDAGNLFSDTHWVPSVHVDNTPGLAIKAYIAANPGTATAQIVAPQTGVWPFAPSMTDFSSRGPNPVAPDIIKPDVTAPGLQILAGNSPFPDAGSVPGELFQAIAGTSMSSPHVAGVFALLKQAHPEWSAAMAKSALMTTAHQNVLDNNRTSPADPFDMGAGHIRPGGEWSKGSVTEPGLVYDAGFLDYLGFMCDAFPAALSNPAATCPALAAAGIPTKAINLNYPSIGISQVPGTKTVTRTVTSVAKESGWRTYSANVVAPPGYTVSVSPATIRLRTGQSATFTVTVTNVSAPVGQWRFGSLTWREKDGNYSVYSPIAVKGALFEGPAEVSGSYSVSFGYTGAFTASARGLVPAAITASTVLDDPTNGNCSLTAPNAQLVSVVVPAGTTYARFQLFDADVAPTSDIDICVFNGASPVGSSTSGTSAEVVNLLNPAAGSYTVVVHGWGVPGSSPFKLHTWVLGSTAAGNMTVSAPSSATIGTIGNINLTFTGLVSGTKYLGSVAYNGVPGLPNPTIVRVDVP
jgi:subtilisin family serine protease